MTMLWQILKEANVHFHAKSINVSLSFLEVMGRKQICFVSQREKFCSEIRENLQIMTKV